MKHWIAETHEGEERIRCDELCMVLYHKNIGLGGGGGTSRSSVPWRGGFGTQRATKEEIDTAIVYWLGKVRIEAGERGVTDVAPILGELFLLLANERRVALRELKGRTG